MKSCFIIFCCIPLIVFSQLPTIYIDPFDGKPRSKLHSDSPGHYELVALMNKTQIDKGDSAIITIFFTGYGQISQPKAFISSSATDIFAPSYIIHSFGTSGQNKYYWGGQRYNFDSLPAIFIMYGGITFPSLDTNRPDLHYGLFIDADSIEGSTFITTEQIVNRSPAEIHLHFKKNARADNYKLNIYFTYFNGQEWTTSTTVVDFRINNFIQKHEVLLGILAAAAALVGLLPGFQILYSLIKKIKWSRKKTTKSKKSRVSAGTRQN
jgi:hypothetical protein